MSDPLVENVAAAEASGDPDAIAAAYELLKRQRVSSARWRRELGEDPADGAVEVVLGGRQSGKSVRAVEWVKAGRLEDGTSTRLLVTMDAAQASELVYRAEYEGEHDGLRQNEVMSWRQVRNAVARGRRFDDLEIGVDETAIVLAELLGVPRISFATIMTRNPT